ncbi:vesicle-associated protein 1-1 [Phtheirospermum japonicum]|uniref:Vesicle-associated protein 1-1 n=1 Tax=Phtheirospermum japonicum TaxID=374723 RepID=A0A830B4T9_9LAMI|nr:vesicle-associated protein 1-1 [Phtheirospermum japonicum]
MNNTQLVEIQPRELKFKFEVKKQISCVGHLANVTDQYVAFKFKTTSPKMYCVKPHVVTKQAQSSAPPGMLCNDKFLFQATVVPIGTTKDEITRGNFAADSSKTIEEVKLRVTLTSGPNVWLIDEEIKRDDIFEASCTKLDDGTTSWSRTGLNQNVT